MKDCQTWYKCILVRVLFSCDHQHLNIAVWITSKTENLGKTTLTVSDFNITSKNSVGFILHHIKFIVIEYGQMGYFSQSYKYILLDIDFIFKLLARISHYIYISWVVKSKYGKIYLIYKKISFILCQIYILWFIFCLSYLNSISI